MAVPLADAEDLDLVTEYILLPLIIQAFERDREAIEVFIKSPEAYTRWINLALERVFKDVKENKRRMRDRGLKVITANQTQLGLDAEYLCRGYTGKMSMLWSRVAVKCRLKMEEYLGMDISIYGTGRVPEWTGDK